MPENKFPTEIITLPSKGYFYPENDIDKAFIELKKIIENHAKSLKSYKSNCDQILNKFSSKNEKNIIDYKEIIIENIGNNLI